PWPILVLGMATLLPIACQKGKFSEDKTVAETYEIKVVDPSGSDAIATIEGPDGTNDSKDAGGAGTGTGTGADGTGTGGVDTGDAGKGTTGGGTNDPDDPTDTVTGNGSDKGTGKGKGSGKGNDADAGACASIAGVNKDRVKVSGSQKSVTLSPSDAFALKVTGNQNQVHLKMSADAPGARVSAICIFATGNQSHVTMDIGISVGKIYIKARGNKALVEATVSKSGVVESMQVDANGNQPSIVMQGEGTYPCDAAAVTCVKP
ncbi:MAG TPA: hypothetical protein VE954_27885, partial [Oligoflexus sp.]